jgi:hypothetical protein
MTVSSGADPLVVFLSSRMTSELNDVRRMTVDALRGLRQFVTLWRFEDHASDSRPPEDVFLEGVRRSDVIIFIAGSDISDPVESEIVEALRCHTDILVFLLQSETRSPRLVEVIKKLKDFATVAVVAWAQDSIRSAIFDAVRNHILTKARNVGRPATRSHYLSRLMVESRARSVNRWTAAGVNDSIAGELSADQAIGMLDAAGVPMVRLLLLRGEVGAGKSLALERMYQGAIHQAESDAFAPIPILIRAQDVIPNLRVVLEPLSEPLGNPEVTGISLFIDDLDQIGPRAALGLLNDADVLARTFPSTRVVVAGRDLFIHSKWPFIRIPLLDQEEVARLVARLTGKPVEYWEIARDAPESVLTSMQRPLFTILYAQYALNSARRPRSSADLVRSLVENALAPIEAADLSANDKLLELSAAVLDSGSDFVPSGTVGGLSVIASLLETRLLSESDSKIGFALPIVA